MATPWPRMVECLKIFSPLYTIYIFLPTCALKRSRNQHSYVTRHHIFFDFIVEVAVRYRQSENIVSLGNCSFHEPCLIYKCLSRQFSKE